MLCSSTTTTTRSTIRTSRTTATRTIVSSWSSRAHTTRAAFTASVFIRQQMDDMKQWTSHCSLFHTSSIRPHQEVKFASDTPQVSITFVDPKKPSDQQNVVVKAFVGDNLLRVAHKNAIDLEGACEGACACSTCHVILEQDIYDGLEEPTEDEEDMLDMAFGLTDTSRLGCQVLVSQEMDGTTIQLPAATRNFYVDGHVPKPH